MRTLAKLLFFVLVVLTVLLSMNIGYSRAELSPVPSSVMDSAEPSSLFESLTSNTMEHTMTPTTTTTGLDSIQASPVQSQGGAESSYSLEQMSSPELHNSPVVSNHVEVTPMISVVDETTSVSGEVSPSVVNVGTTMDESSRMPSQPMDSTVSESSIGNLPLQSSNVEQFTTASVQISNVVENSPVESSVNDVPAVSSPVVESSAGVEIAHSSNPEDVTVSAVESSVDVHATPVNSPEFSPAESSYTPVHETPVNSEAPVYSSPMESGIGSPTESVGNVPSISQTESVFATPVSSSLPENVISSVDVMETLLVSPVESNLPSPEVSVVGSDNTQSPIASNLNSPSVSIEETITMQSPSSIETSPMESNQQFESSPAMASPAESNIASPIDSNDAASSEFNQPSPVVSVEVSPLESPITEYSSPIAPLQSSDQIDSSVEVSAIESIQQSVESSIPIVHSSPVAGYSLTEESPMVVESSHTAEESPVYSSIPAGESFVDSPSPIVPSSTVEAVYSSNVDVSSPAIHSSVEMSFETSPVVSSEIEISPVESSIPVVEPTVVNSPSPVDSPVESSISDESSIGMSPIDSPVDSSAIGVSPVESTVPDFESTIINSPSPVEPSPAESSNVDVSPMESPAESSMVDISPTESFIPSPAESSFTDVSPVESLTESSDPISPIYSSAIEVSPMESSIPVVEPTMIDSPSPVEPSPAESSFTDASPIESTPAESSFIDISQSEIPLESSFADISLAESSPDISASESAIESPAASSFADFSSIQSSVEPSYTDASPVESSVEPSIAVSSIPFIDSSAEFSTEPSVQLESSYTGVSGSEIPMESSGVEDSLYPSPTQPMDSDIQSSIGAESSYNLDSSVPLDSSVELSFENSLESSISFAESTIIDITSPSPAESSFIEVSPSESVTEPSLSETIPMDSSVEMSFQEGPMDSSIELSPVESSIPVVEPTMIDSPSPVEPSPAESSFIDISQSEIPRESSFLEPSPIFSSVDESSELPTESSIDVSVLESAEYTTSPVESSFTEVSPVDSPVESSIPYESSIGISPIDSPVDSSAIEVSPVESSVPVFESPVEPSPVESSNVDVSPVESPAESSMVDASPTESFIPSPAESSVYVSPVESPVDSSVELSPGESSIPVAESTAPVAPSPIESSTVDVSPAETSALSPAESSVPVESSTPLEPSPVVSPVDSGVVESSGQESSPQSPIESPVESSMDIEETVFNSPLESSTQVAASSGTAQVSPTPVFSSESAPVESTDFPVTPTPSIDISSPTASSGKASESVQVSPASTVEETVQESTNFPGEPTVIASPVVSSPAAYSSPASSSSKSAPIVSSVNELSSGVETSDVPIKSSPTPVEPTDIFASQSAEESIPVRESSDVNVSPADSSTAPAQSSSPVPSGEVPILNTTSTTITGSVFSRANELVIQVSSSPSSRASKVVYAWSATSSGTAVDLRQYTTRSLNRAVLYIPAGVLPAGKQFTFQVSAYYSDVANANVATKKYSIVVTRPPVAGSITINPESGTCLVDTFNITAVSWTDPEGGSLQYIFSYIDSKNSVIDLGVSQSSNILLTTLPSGTNNGRLTIRIRATTSFGDFITATQEVTVASLPDSQIISGVTAELDNLSDEDPAYFAKASIALTVLQNKLSGPLSSAEKTQVQSLLLASIEKTARALDRLFSGGRAIRNTASLESTQRDALSVANSLLLATAYPDVLSTELITTTVSTIQKLFNAPISAQIYGDELFQALATLIDNLQLGYQALDSKSQFASNIQTLLTQLLKLSPQSLALGNQRTTVKETYSTTMWNALLDSSLSDPVTVGSSARRVAAQSVDVSLSTDLADAAFLSGDSSIYALFTKYETLPAGYTSSNRTTLMQDTIHVDALRTSNVASISNQLQDMYTVRFQVSASPSYTANYFPTNNAADTFSPTCRYLSGSSWVNDTSVCYVQSVDSTTVTCSCSRFATTVGVSLDYVVIPIPFESSGTAVPSTKVGGGGGLSAGAAVGIVIAVIAGVVVVSIIFAIVAILIVLSIRRKQRIQKAFGNSKDITKYMTDANHFELDDI